MMYASVLVVWSLLFTTSMAYESSFRGRSSFSLSDLLNKPRESTTAEPMPSWTGKYFPTPPPTKSPSGSLSMHGGVPMGTSNPGCDDAKTNLTKDWNMSPWEHTCLFSNLRFVPDFNIQPMLEIEHVPKLYSAVHYCMNETITYLDPTPTFGPHRPAWPRYGEYTFLPVQRWLHTLEHGGVVMLYHPCAHPLEVQHLRQIVTSCLFRHVISPSRHLKTERPLALLTWGKRLTMSAVNPEIVKDFIKQNALDGPERISRDGQYDLELIKASTIVSDTEDVDLCPEGKHSYL